MAVDLPYPVLMHDMAVTANHLVVLYLPLCFDTKVSKQAGAPGLPICKQQHVFMKPSTVEPTSVLVPQRAAATVAPR